MVSEALIAGLIDVWMSSCWRYGVIDFIKSATHRSCACIVSVAPITNSLTYTM